MGVVIPTLDEERALPGLLADLGKVLVPLDVVVVDGGSRDRTAAVATAAGIRVVRRAPGRAGQLNAGAAAVEGAWLLFLHADSRLPPSARRALLAAVTDEPDLSWGVFRFALDLGGFWGWLIALGQRVRQRMLGLPYGDQGLLVSRELFDAVGGFPDLPLMEDVAMVQRLRRRAALRTLPAPLVTSGRRYVARGAARTWLWHSALLALYLLGMSPARLARWRGR
jgi:hypothetical protein